MNLQINTEGYQQNQVREIPEILTKDSLAQLRQELQLSAGQILSGRVMSMDGESIKLLLDNKQTISAHLNGDLQIGVGQLLSFEVKSTANSQTELRPVYTNLSDTSTVGAALSEADLPLTDRNVSMVENMMEEGMSVNKQALLDMVSHLNEHPDVSPATLVQMQKLNLPMDASTIQQFENYQNFEHQIENDVQNMNEALANLPEELLLAGDEEGAFVKASDVLALALNETEAVAPEMHIPMEERPIPDIVRQLSEIMGIRSDADNPNLPDASGEGGIGEKMSYAQADTQNAGTEAAGQEQNVRQLTPDQTNTLLKLTGELLNAYKLDPSSLSDEDKELLKEALKDPALKDALSQKLTAQLQLKPEDVGKDGKVEELYKRILEQSNRAIDILSNTTENAAQAAKSAQNLTDNVQFMNHLNEMMAYVQLPLKMSEENAHGDLYVFANKKKLAQNDGNFSALLHLDMEHLGPMDVHVAMQQEKVSTHFYMQDEELLDFIEANIHILNERLTKKGYQMNTTVSVKEDPNPKSVIDEFIKQENNGSVSVVSTMSFDVRA
ncbi:MAG: flagellar hook-length control protein FliK [Lachnospiraceae bacterium]|nr:flagellar hook-length control protein FliK [Lachnospiraceae bacterium]